MERKGRTGRELKGQTGKVKWKIKATACMGKKKCKETHRKAGEKRKRQVDKGGRGREMEETGGEEGKKGAGGSCSKGTKEA